ncbi:MAG: preprotein translocase subunit SecG, preprotein translocase subunit SecG [Candidatus Peregrinibacteria bacterium GW2011_GWF2_38_29]|nr:MAG: preprotein translocase subunit SecG, preprotein translocase subunit SecG [Candidatus Peregrinibacteria bacterium GW2011_GWF2_38_29]HBB03012.1 preprotein translocase subunit SecG [Candidatus Peregrinibacteria bacterium]
MKTILSVAHIVVSILLMISILSQQRGAALGASFGGTGSTYHTKRGAEKVLFIATIIFAVLFAGLSVAILFVK